MPSGQKLEDMDISVHCDITIFDWLMRWVKKDSLLEDNWPKLGELHIFIAYIIFHPNFDFYSLGTCVSVPTWLVIVTLSRRRECGADLGICGFLANGPSSSGLSRILSTSHEWNCKDFYQPVMPQWQYSYKVTCSKNKDIFWNKFWYFI